ncbi:hypothetical protein D3C77_432280 [compost metagenome]
MTAGLVQAFSRRFDTNQLDRGIREKRGKHAHRIGATAHAGDDLIGQAAMFGEELLAGLGTDDRLEIADHLRERMRADHRTDGVDVIVRVLQVLLEGAVHRFLERRRAAGHRHQLAAEDLHLGDVGVFFLDVHLAHVNLAGNSHQRAGGGQGHAVLAGAGFGDDLGLAHELGQQRFAQAVVDLVRAGVVEVFAFQVDLRAAELFRQAPGVEDRAGASDVVGEQTGQFLLEVFALADFLVGGVDVVHCLLEVRRYQLAAVGAEVAERVGHGCKVRVLSHGVLVLVGPMRLGSLSGEKTHIPAQDHGQGIS